LATRHCGKHGYTPAYRHRSNLRNPRSVGPRARHPPTPSTSPSPSSCWRASGPAAASPPSAPTPGARRAEGPDQREPARRTDRQAPLCPRCPAPVHLMGLHRQQPPASTCGGVQSTRPCAPISWLLRSHSSNCEAMVQIFEPKKIFSLNRVYFSERCETIEKSSDLFSLVAKVVSSIHMATPRRNFLATCHSVTTDDTVCAWVPRRRRARCGEGYGGRRGGHCLPAHPRCLVTAVPSSSSSPPCTSLVTEHPSTPRVAILERCHSGRQRFKSSRSCGVLIQTSSRALCAFS